MKNPPVQSTGYVTVGHAPQPAAHSFDNYGLLLIIAAVPVVWWLWEKFKASVNIDGYSISGWIIALGLILIGVGCVGGSVGFLSGWPVVGLIVGGVVVMYIGDQAKEDFVYIPPARPPVPAAVPHMPVHVPTPDIHGLQRPATYEEAQQALNGGGNFGSNQIGTGTQKTRYRYED